MTRLWLIRHGPTHASGFTGWTDLPADLSDTSAIARLSAALPHAPVLSSPLLRARQTAAAISGPRPRLPEDPNWTEIHFGDWEARNFTDIETETPGAVRQFLEDPDHPAPSGESWTAFCTRIQAAIESARAFPEPDLIVVAHRGTIAAALQITLGLSFQNAQAFQLDPLGLSRLDHHGNGQWSAERVNHRP